MSLLDEEYDPWKGVTVRQATAKELAQWRAERDAHVAGMLARGEKPKRPVGMGRWGKSFAATPAA